MAERVTFLAPAIAARGIPQGLETVVVEDVHVLYRVYEDVRPTLGGKVANRFRTRQFREVHAIRGVSFTARSGEAIGIIGANGSGKSTLMRAVAGLLPVNSGAVYARSAPMLLGVGAALNKRLSGRRNILLGGLALGLTTEEILAREDDIIDFAGIRPFIDLPMQSYSSGMSARLQFAISAAVEPEILIVDEALSVGDEDFREKSSRRIRKLRDQAGTVFLVSHSMRSILDTCTRVLWIDRGVLRLDGEPAEVIERYRKTMRRRRRRRRRRARARRAAAAAAQVTT